MRVLLLLWDFALCLTAAATELDCIFHCVKNYCIAAIRLAASKCPPEICI